MRYHATVKYSIVIFFIMSAYSARPSVPALDAILGKELPALDYGFVRVVDYMGDDDAVVQSARVSYGKGTKQRSQDEGLIRYLMRHYHTTPFEMCEIKLHIKAPVFVARQWLRHRMASVNEYSARYSMMEDQFYIPEQENMRPQSVLNKQGRDEAARLSEEEAVRADEIFRGDAARCYGHYSELINTDADGNILDDSRQGVARELARMNLPVNVYTQWYWKIDLHNLLHFLRLRADSHAQYEIRVYAEIIEDIVKIWVPAVYRAYMDYRKASASFSREQMNVVKDALDNGGTLKAQSDTGLTAREYRELLELLER